MVKVARGVAALDAPLSESVVTVGTFDGVHVGHQALVARAVARARELRVPAVAYTFEPHPAQILAPERAPPMLTSMAERVRAFASLGVDWVVAEPFDRAFSEIGADEWVRDHLFARLAPRAVVVGFNFSYGRGRAGDPAHLLRSGAALGFEVDTLGPVSLDGEVVSSSRIRRLLAEGAVGAAARLLGRPFAIAGEVVAGDRRGRTIGFPTANLSPATTIVPAYGVYAAWAVLDGARRVPAVVNVGRRPTFAGIDARAEAHLLDFSGDLYGQELRLELLEHLRGERRFDGIDALVTQIRADIAAARARLG